jgi:hypothetical protein
MALMMDGVMREFAIRSARKTRLQNQALRLDHDWS